MMRLISSTVFTGLYALGALASIESSEIHQAFPNEPPPPASNSELTQAAVLVEYRLRNCTFPLLQRDTKVHELAPGKCHKIWSSHSFRIRSPATCPDGSLAELALYADEQCNVVHTWMDPNNNRRVHIEVGEKDIGDDTTCFDTGEVDPPRYRSKNHDYFDMFLGRHGIAFVCKGMSKLVIETEREANNFVTEDHSPSKHGVVSPLPHAVGRPQKQGDGDDKPQGGGSVLGLVLALAIFGLVGLLILATALYRFAVVATWIMNLFRPREGAISLS